MTTEQLVKRADRSQALKCMRLKDGTFLVESSDGKIMYPVSINGTLSCTCADFQRNKKTDAAFQCKHIIAALECTTGEEIAEPAERKKPKLDERFIKNLQGKDFVLYNGLLDLAHQKGLIRMDVEIIQYPTPENGNEAVCRAIAETKHGERYADIGDASPKNTNKVIASHIIRMASTRAKGRTLRDLTNIGMTCVEELGDLDEVLGADKSIKSVKPIKKDTPPDVKPAAIPAEPEKPKLAPVKELKPTENPKPKLEPVKMETKHQSIQPKDQPTGNGSKVSEAQLRAMMNVGRRRGMTIAELDDLAKKEFGVAVQELTSASASQFLKRIQTAA